MTTNLYRQEKQALLLCQERLFMVLLSQPIFTHLLGGQNAEILDFQGFQRHLVRMRFAGSIPAISSQTQSEMTGFLLFLRGFLCFFAGLRGVRLHFAGSRAPFAVFLSKTRAKTALVTCPGSLDFAGFAGFLCGQYGCQTDGAFQPAGVV